MYNAQSPFVSVDPLPLLQDRFAIMKLNGEVRLVDRQEIADAKSGKRLGDVDFYKDTHANKLISRYLETIACSSPTKNVIDHFWKNPNTHVYDAIAFDPRPTPPETLNYWVSSPVMPAQGNASVVMAFLRSIICDGNVEVYDYLISFLAHMLQHPEEKPGVMFVLLGGQGIGKGTFFRLLSAIWPRTFLQVSDVNNVTGTFNACLERHYAVCMDEALFAGDKRAVDRLKSLITEPVISVEQKYQPRRTIASFHRFFAASNSEHFAHTDLDDRRFLYLRVSSARQNDHSYFENLHKSIEDPVQISAFVYELLAVNLTQFKARQRPRSLEHVNQKLQSLDGFDRFWHETLQLGEIACRRTYGVIDRTSWDDSVFVGTRRLIDAYREYNQGSRQFRPPSSLDVKRTLRKYCPGAKARRHEVLGRQERGYQLPSLYDARKAFEFAMGGALDWGERPGSGDNWRSAFSEDQLEALWETYQLSVEAADTENCQ
jgi:hypothetical protein